MIAVADKPKKKTLTLQVLADEAQALFELWAMDGGEVTEVSEELEREWLEQLAAKGDGYGDFHTEVKNRIALLKAHEAPLDAEKERLRSQRKALEGKLEWMTRNVLLFMQRTGKERIEGDRWKIRVQKNGQPALLVDVLPGALPGPYQQWTVEANREALVTDLANGVIVPGARLETVRRAGHFVPLDAPADLAALLRAHVLGATGRP